MAADAYADSNYAKSRTLARNANFRSIVAVVMATVMVTVTVMVTAMVMATVMVVAVVARPSCHTYISQLCVLFYNSTFLSCV